MTRFRPCIDLHSGQVKQIVGSTLTTASADLKTNYVSKLPAAHFAKLYKDDELTGGHVIMLGPGNEEAAKEALAQWKGGLQIGGGITDANAAQWIEWGAEKVIITSCLFPAGRFSQERLDAVLSSLGGNRHKLVIDLSCRRKDDTWFVAMNKWQTITDMEVKEESIKSLEPYCSEFLIHAADNEGLQLGIDEKLVQRLAEWCSIPVTYAGGGRNLEDLDKVENLSEGKVDLTIGSALDIFGGNGVKFQDCIEWNKSRLGTEYYFMRNAKFADKIIQDLQVFCEKPSRATSPAFLSASNGQITVSFSDSKASTPKPSTAAGKLKERPADGLCI